MMEELLQKPLYELRLIGREIGVKSPTSLTKKELVEKIIEIKKGKQKPVFSKKGRPSYIVCDMDKLNKKVLDKIDKILENAKKEIIDLLTKK
ncbi:MAG: Rho termination factor N-terminal domain-containing protein [Clostridia bacterium]|nr:Rho termination factor N-terminal domain-containing protein [Clostridia bacterium]